MKIQFSPILPCFVLLSMMSPAQVGRTDQPSSPMLKDLESAKAILVSSKNRSEARLHTFQDLKYKSSQSLALTPDPQILSNFKLNLKADLEDAARSLQKLRLLQLAQIQSLQTRAAAQTSLLERRILEREAAKTEEDRKKVSSALSDLIDLRPTLDKLVIPSSPAARGNDKALKALEELIATVEASINGLSGRISALSTQIQEEKDRLLTLENERQKKLKEERDAKEAEEKARREKEAADRAATEKAAEEERKKPAPQPAPEPPVVSQSAQANTAVDPKKNKKKDKGEEKTKIAKTPSTTQPGFGSGSPKDIMDQQASSLSSDWLVGIWAATLQNPNKASLELKFNLVQKKVSGSISVLLNGRRCEQKLDMISTPDPFTLTAKILGMSCTDSSGFTENSGEPGTLKLDLNRPKKEIRSAKIDHIFLRRSSPLEFRELVMDKESSCKGLVGKWHGTFKKSMFARIVGENVDLNYELNIVPEGTTFVVEYKVTPSKVEKLLPKSTPRDLKGFCEPQNSRIVVRSGNPEPAIQIYLKQPSNSQGMAAMEYVKAVKDVNDADKERLQLFREVQLTREKTAK